MFQIATSGVTATTQPGQQRPRTSDSNTMSPALDMILSFCVPSSNTSVPGPQIPYHPQDSALHGQPTLESMVARMSSWPRTHCLIEWWHNLLKVHGTLSAGVHLCCPREFQFQSQANCEVKGSTLFRFGAWQRVHRAIFLNIFVKICFA